MSAYDLRLLARRLQGQLALGLPPPPLAVTVESRRGRVRYTFTTPAQREAFDARRWPAPSQGRRLQIHERLALLGFR